MKKILASVLVLGLGAAALAGPADNSLNVAASQEPVVIGGDPLTVLTAAAIRSEIEVYLDVGLYGSNLEGELVPHLATEVATVENGRLRFEDMGDDQQRLEIDITLRDEAVWSDGTPITSQDASLCIEMGKTPGMPVALPDYWERINIEVQDEKNFTIIMEPAQNSDLLGSPSCLAPAHVMGGSWEEARASAEALNVEADAERVAEIYTGFFSQFGSPEGINQGRMVYTGAFIPTRWSTGSALEMTRNPNFFMHPENQENYVQTVQFQFISDTNALLIAILGGGIDATSSVAISFDQGISPTLQNRAAGRFDIWFIPSPIWEHLEVNQFTELETVQDLQLNDVRTRRALLHSIDREALVEALFEGLQPVAHSNVNPNDPWFNPDVPQFNFDPEAASALFAELGWEPGADGILQRTTEDGRTVRFELEFVTTAGNAVRERVQQFIAEDLQQVGVAVRINNAPAGVVFSNEFINRAYEGSYSGMFMFAWISSRGATANAETYLCANAPRPENNFTGQNTAGSCVPEYDELRSRAVREFDLEAAAPLYQEMQTIFAENVMALPLYFRSNPLVTSVGLNNFVTNTFANFYGYTPVEPWLVGWEQNGVEKIYDQADYSLVFGEEQ